VAVKKEILVCDLEPPGRDVVKGVRSYRIGLDGQLYEGEACPKHLAALAKMAEPYRAAGRRANTSGVTQIRKPGTHPLTRTTAQRHHSAAIRLWASSEGIEVSPRGRIPGDVVTKWENRDRSKHVREPGTEPASATQ
jgi:hypothetical protein